MEDSSQARGSQMQSTSQRNGGVLSVKGWASVKLSEFLPEHRPPDPADTIPIFMPHFLRPTIPDKEVHRF